MRRPLVADHRRGKVIGFICLTAGFVLLWDAYEGHGQRKPAALGPILPW